MCILKRAKNLFIRPRALCLARSNLMTMSLPGGVSVLVDEDELIDRVVLDDHRSLFVTPSKAITHRERSLLTEESVESYPTDVDRLSLEEGKRQVTVTFEYHDGSTRELQLPMRTMAAALKALLASVIRATDVIVEGEAIVELYRFNELTVIVTDKRLLKHVGQALWADSYDAIDFDIIRNIMTETGQVSTGVNIETTDGGERLKIPHETADRFVSRLEEAVLSYHDVVDLGVLRGDPEAGKPAPEPDLDRLRPLQVNDPYEADDPSRKIGKIGEEPTGLLEDTEKERTDHLETLHELRRDITQQRKQLDDYEKRLEQLENELIDDQ